MYLYKPKEKAQSEPVDFWYLPANSNIENNLNNLALNGSPIKQEQGGGIMVKPESIKPVKRGRPPKQQQDEPSDGKYFQRHVCHTVCLN